MKGKISEIELMPAIKDYVPEQAKITLIVERTTPEQKAEIIRLLECKASVNNEVEIDIQPTKEHDDTHKPT